MSSTSACRHFLLLLSLSWFGETKTAQHDSFLVLVPWPVCTRCFMFCSIHLDFVLCLFTLYMIYNFFQFTSNIFFTVMLFLACSSGLFASRFGWKLVTCCWVCFISESTVSQPSKIYVLKEGFFRVSSFVLKETALKKSYNNGGNSMNEDKPVVQKERNSKMQILNK